MCTRMPAQASTSGRVAVVASGNPSTVGEGLRHPGDRQGRDGATGSARGIGIWKGAGEAREDRNTVTFFFQKKLKVIKKIVWDVNIFLKK